MTIDFNLRNSVVQPPGQQADATTCGGQNPADGDPITTARVDAAANDAYTIGFMPAGNFP